MEIFAVFVMLGLGLVHGLIPDEHTWPITIPYALGQENPRKAVLSTVIFTGALTIVWSILTIVVSAVGNIFLSEQYNSYVFIFAGLTMVGVAVFIFLPRISAVMCSRVNDEYYSKNIIHRFVTRVGCRHVHGDLGFTDLRMAPPYKAIWIHGLVAAFGTGFLLVIVYTTALTFPVYLGFVPGMLFGIGTMISLSFIGYIVRKGAELGVKNEEHLQKRARKLGYAGLYLLLAMGIFMITLGILALFGIEIHLEIL